MSLSAARPDKPAPTGPVLLSGFELTSTDGSWPADSATWLPAVVPGGVHESLMAAGLLEHPFLDDHETDARWIEDSTWWYRATFAAPPDLQTVGRLQLRFDCLDTVCAVTLNGSQVGSFRNQHRPHTVDITDHLRPSNELVLRFAPPLKDLPDDAATAAVDRLRQRRRALRPGAAEQDVSDVLLAVQRTHLRKATFSWGWDFAPRIPSLGLAGPATLQRTADAHLKDVRVVTESLDLDARRARLTVSLCVQDHDVADEVVISVRSPTGVCSKKASTAQPALRCSFDLDDVEPWWTHDLGGQPLYTVDVRLLAGAEVKDQRTLRVGVRTIELDRSADSAEDARHFRFLLNGCPIYARGANWVPPSMLVGSTPELVRRTLLRLARDAGMTMLRVWGGGVYEPDHFYDACDELGILVWQDFMFACFDYPSNDVDLLAEVDAEARHQVERLRHHACLAIWCGNNEVQAIHEIATGDVDPHGGWGWSIFHELLPALVSELDPVTAYWPGSPWGENGTELLNGISDGDRHAWEVWHGVDVGAQDPTVYASRGEAVHFKRYSQDRGRFISEFGIHASPELTTLQRWATTRLDLHSAAFQQRNKDSPPDKALALMEAETGLPTTIEQYVDFSMACQAEGLKHGAEHYRRRLPHCNGALVWQLNDSWPGLSWSIVDFDLVPKASYYFLQRAFRPLVASFAFDDATVELWMSNAALHEVTVPLIVEIGDLTGSDPRREEVIAQVPAYSSLPVWSAPRPQPQQCAWVTSPDLRVTANRQFFAPIKELPPFGTVKGRVQRHGADATVELRAQGYAYLARVTSSHPGAQFSTNYVDLRDGAAQTIGITGLHPAAQLAVSSYGQEHVLL